MKKVLVTGAHGQLARCLKKNSNLFPALEFLFVDKNELNIADQTSVQYFFSKHTFDYCINTAAYTNVEKAEKEIEKPFNINALGVKHVAEACKVKNIILIHISTDYVFNGNKNEPYLETDTTDPINVYGTTKLQGEQYIKDIWSNHFIIRTSWLYSEYGHNFLKSMLQFAKEKKALTITTEQTGTPTNANDLATAILQIIKQETIKFGTYHFSNQGEATWYDFAKAIFEHSGLSSKVVLKKTTHYRTFAQRPTYSILNCTKIIQELGLSIKKWETSLKELIKEGRPV